MKVAIASQDKTLEARTAPRAGRAPYYLIFSDDGELEEVMENSFAQSGGGAGTGVAQMLADKGVEKVILEQVGPKMKMALEDRGVEIQEVNSDAIKNIVSSW